MKKLELEVNNSDNAVIDVVNPYFAGFLDISGVEWVKERVGGKIRYVLETPVSEIKKHYKDWADDHELKKRFAQYGIKSK